MGTEGWRQVVLGDVADIKIGGTPSRSEPRYWDAAKTTSNRWAAISDLKGKYLVDTAEYVSDLGVENSSVKLVPEGTVVMSFKLSIGRAAIVSQPLYTNEAIAAFYTNGEIDNEFLYYALPNTALEDAADVAVKGKTLNKAKLKEILLLLPTKGEQRKIAAILSSVDDAIARTQAVIDQVQTVKKGLMQELLTRGLPGRHTRFKKTEIGVVPEGWEVVGVGDIAAQQKYSCVGGPFGSSLTSSHYVADGVPVIRGGNLTAGRWLSEVGFAYVDSKKADELSRNLAYPGDIIFTQRGTLGQVCRINPNSAHQRFVVSQSQMKLAVNTNLFDPDFVATYFLSELGQQQIHAATVGTGVPHINLSMLKGFKIPKPDVSEQQAISAIAFTLEARERQEAKKSNGLAAVKSSLMSVLLTGQLRVTVDGDEI
ncbi:MAG: restriction endonuclease subunit S [Pseudomonadota bacterium]